MSSPFLLKAGRKAMQCAVLMRSAAGDEQRLDSRLRRFSVWSDAFVAPDNGARQQRHAHVGGDAADHAVERAEFEPRRRRPAEFRKAPARAAADRCSRCGTPARLARTPACRRATSARLLPSPRGDQHQFFAERDRRSRVRHARSDRRRTHRRSCRRARRPRDRPSSTVRRLSRTAGKRRWKSASSGGNRTAAVVSIDPIDSGPFGSPSSRAASIASRDSAAIRSHRAAGGGRRRSGSCRGCAARTTRCRSRLPAP